MLRCVLGIIVNISYSNHNMNVGTITKKQEKEC